MGKLFLLKWAGAGVLATLVMDVGSTAMRKAGLTHGVPIELIGRWFAHILRGRLFHKTIATASDLPGQMPLALATHYLIGISLTIAFGLALHFGPLRLESRPAAFGTAVVYGMLTNVLPWFFMFPAMGFGWLGSEAPAEYLILRSSFLNHFAFGIGLGLVSLFVTSLWKALPQ
jgi:hypothetical protein